MAYLHLPPRQSNGDARGIHDRLCTSPLDTHPQKTHSRNDLQVMNCRLTPEPFRLLDTLRNDELNYHHRENEASRSSLKEAKFCRLLQLADFLRAFYQISQIVLPV